MATKSPSKSKAAGRAIVAGSEKKPLRGAKAVGAVAADEPIDVTLRIRRRPAALSAIKAASAAGKPVSREDFGALYGADPADIARVETFAHEHGFEILEASVPRRTVRISGPASAVKAAFGTTLKRFTQGKTKYRGRTGAISVPSDVHDLIEGVFGLDDRPAAQPHFRVLKEGKSPKKLAKPNAAGAPTPLTPPQVAKIYNFPANLDGTGQTIGIIELGGGYKAADLKTYFKSLGVKNPNVTAVAVSGGHNAPTGDANGPDGEVMLDIEVAGAVAPGARIVVYFAPNTDAGFLNALTTATHDNLRKPCVISISWGSAESNWTSQATSSFDSACADAALLGVTVCVAAGDHGSSDSDDSKVTNANVDFPASSPNVLACGGTTLSTSNGAFASETVWNTQDGWATGGGVSTVFPLPTFQSGAGVPVSVNPGGGPGRGVPDVAGDADSNSGYKVRVDGKNAVIGGTSAVAPLWAGLIALLTQGKKGSLGFLPPKLYALSSASQAFRDIVTGDNKTGTNAGYQAKSGWDACTGLGVPNGAKLLSSL